MTDAEINKAVAQVLKMRLAVSCDCHTNDGLLRNWAQSLDACFRDLVLEARSYQLSLQCLWSSDSDNPDDNAAYWTARFADQYCQNLSATDASPSRTICLAWLKTKEAA